MHHRGGEDRQLDPAEGLQRPVDGTGGNAGKRFQIQQGQEGMATDEKTEEDHAQFQKKPIRGGKGGELYPDIPLRSNTY